MTYRIHEIETNTTYDDVYNTVADAMEQIKKYEADDKDPEDPRSTNVTYEVVMEDGRPIKLWVFENNISRASRCDSTEIFDISQADHMWDHYTKMEQKNCDEFFVGYAPEDEAAPGYADWDEIWEIVKKYK